MNLILQWDSGEQDPDRILMFASDECLRQIHTVIHFYSDGCMRNIPVMFYQLYSIHGKLVRLLDTFQNLSKLRNAAWSID